MIDRLKHVPLGAWIFLTAFVLAVSFIIIWAPPTMWAALERADWKHIAGVITLVGTALAGVYRAFRKPMKDEEDDS